MPRSIALTGVITLFICFLGVSPTLKPTPDSSEYIGLAQSLATGQGYTFNGYRGSHHPPLTSLVLAGIMALTGNPQPAGLTLILMKAAQLLMALGFALGAWRIAHRYLDDRQAQLVGLLVLANLVLFQHSMYILSDVLYCFLSLWALVMFQEKLSRKKWLLGAALIGLAWITRMIGVALGVALVGWVLFGKHHVSRWRQRYPLLPLLLALIVIPLLAWKILCPADYSYMEAYSKLTGETNLGAILLNRIITVVPTTPLRAVQVTLNIEQIILPLPVVLPFFLVLVLVWFRMFYRKLGLPEWYVLFYMIIISTAADQGPRYYLPLLPFFLIYSFLAFNWAGRYWKTRENHRRVFILAFTGLAVLLLAYLAFAARNGRPIFHPVAFLRGGLLYLLLAVSLALWGCLLAGRIPPRPVPRWIPTLFLAAYLGTGWLYGIGYAMLEHGWLRSRPPMLMGYAPYYRLGRTLKTHPDIPEPLLCAHPSIVHLGAGKLTRAPLPDVHATCRQLRHRRYRSTAFLHPAPPAGPGENDANQVIRILTEHYPEYFRPVERKDIPEQFHVYLIQENALVACTRNHPEPTPDQ